LSLALAAACLLYTMVNWTLLSMTPALIGQTHQSLAGEAKLPCVARK